MSLTMIALSLMQSVLPSSAHAQFMDTVESKVTAPTDIPVPTAVSYDISQNSTSMGYSLNIHEGDGLVYGFSFDNVGTNAIIPSPAQIGMGPERSYSFNFIGRSRQDIEMHVTDIPDEFLSHMMETSIYFFPRKNLPAIQWPTADAPDQSKFTVVLPTGESVLFDTQSKTIVGGVMKETRAIDLNPDRFSRKFAGLSYSGTGVMVRLDKRGNDPHINTTATITQGAKKCTLPSTLLFDQADGNASEFLFLSDEAFNTLLKTKCRISFL